MQIHVRNQFNLTDELTDCFDESLGSVLGRFDPNHMTVEERRESGYGHPMPLNSVRARIDAWRVNNPK